MKGIIFSKVILGFFILMTIVDSCTNESQEIVTFTKPKVPFIRTSEFNCLSEDIAVCWGKILNYDNQDTLIKYGICWSKDPTPTINDNIKYSFNSYILPNTLNNLGFSSILTGLKENTEYYFRGFATNKNGIGYGSPQKIVTSQKPVSEGGDTLILKNILLDNGAIALNLKYDSKNKLTEIVEYFSTIFFDHNDKRTFSYDEYGRLSSCDVYYLNGSTISVNHTIFKYTNTNDEFISIFAHIENGVEINDTSFFHPDGKIYLIKHYNNHEIDHKVKLSNYLTFKYENNKMIEITYNQPIYKFDQNNNLTSDFYLYTTLNTYEYDQIGNVTRDRFFRPNENNIQILQHENLYKYDDKKNPFTIIFKQLGVLCGNIHPGIYINKNNIIEKKSISYVDDSQWGGPPPGQITTEKYSYIYNKNEYPVTITGGYFYFLDYQQ